MIVNKQKQLISVNEQLLPAGKGGGREPMTSFPDRQVLLLTVASEKVKDFHIHTHTFFRAKTAYPQVCLTPDLAFFTTRSPYTQP